MSEKLQCPVCKRNDNLTRIEAVLAYADILVTDDGQGFEYVGESHVDWNTQDRNLLANAKGPNDGETIVPIPEFLCNECGTNFNWDSTRGFTDVEGKEIPCPQN